MNIKKTLILGVVLVAAILYLTRVSEPRRQAELLRDKLFSGLIEGRIESFKVEPQAAATYTLVRSGANADGGVEWGFEDLPRGKLDNQKVALVLNALKELLFEGPIADSDLARDFSIYGLDRPTLTLTIAFPQGEKREVAFGKKSEYLMKRYAKVSGQSGLFLVEEQGFQGVLRGRDDLRLKAPVAFLNADLRELVMESPHGSVTITQPAVGEWRIVAPQNHEGSKAAIEQLLGAIRNLTVEEFIDGGEARLGDFGLNAPQVRVLLSFREGLKERSLRVILGESQGSGYFTYEGAPSVFKVKAEKIAPLIKKLSELRERKLFKFTGSDIERVLSGGSADAPVEIRTTNTDWSVNGKVSDPVFVEELLREIVQVESVDFPLTVPADAFSQPFLTLTISKKAPSTETQILYIGKEAPTGAAGAARYAKVSEAGEVSLIRDIEVKRIVPHEEALVQRATPVPGTPGAATGK